MSKTMTSAIASEDHFSHLPPTAGGQPERLTPVSLGSHDGARLHELVQQMRQSVVTATLATDVAAKIKLWELYRTARTEAIAMVASADKLRTGHAQRAHENSVA
jgi:hypothetical protein